MKYIVLFVFGMLITLMVIAQYPKGSPSPYSNGFIQHGYVKADSGQIIPNRDTNWTPRFAGTLVRWQTFLWIWETHWSKYANLSSTEKAIVDDAVRKSIRDTITAVKVLSNGSTVTVLNNGTSAVSVTGGNIWAFNTIPINATRDISYATRGSSFTSGGSVTQLTGVITAGSMNELVLNNTGTISLFRTSSTAPVVSSLVKIGTGNFGGSGLPSAFLASTYFSGSGNVGKMAMFSLVPPAQVPPSDEGVPYSGLVDSLILYYAPDLALSTFADSTSKHKFFLLGEGRKEQVVLKSDTIKTPNIATGSPTYYIGMNGSGQWFKNDLSHKADYLASTPTAIPNGTYTGVGATGSLDAYASATSGTVTITTTTVVGGGAAKTLCSVLFGAAFPNVPHITLSPSNEAAQALGIYEDRPSTSVNAFQVKSTNALANDTVYILTYYASK